MLIEREYRATQDELLYHYCSPETFLAICSSKTLRLSDIFSMNDFLEMHWGYARWAHVATKRAENSEAKLVESIDHVVSSSTFNVLPLAACFSLGGDMLSQWRAYAQNGLGFSLGFKADSLCQMAARPLRVLYDQEKQEREIEDFIATMEKVAEAEGHESDDFFEFCTCFACDLAALKNPSFSEEQEVRLIHLVNFVRSNDSIKIQSYGGTSFGHEAPPLPIGFSMRGSVPVPHIDMSFLDSEGNHPLARVILGPKNEALASAISVFLETVGLGGVEVLKSQSSYR
ncbi:MULTISPECIES: DUF2971 domain-containing protein [Luteimonas]|uniref:DUF2971 domain-containing protein n=1 Tax=Luteimonas TaxID=83614 RepID=UPI000C797405|nr:MULTISPECIES: DUF2971 domain-containing protein [Luteimonas]